ncbi:MAG: Ig-like domain-containing protein [Fimbriimonadia bacterium]|nr:Ig-like domain-containing protein [Fimbriimonadia bacterium]
MKRKQIHLGLSILTAAILIGCGGGGGGTTLPATGTLAVNSSPTGGKIYLNGVDTGSTTNTTLTVPRGNQTVRIEVTQSGKTYRADRTVAVSASATVQVSFTQRKIESTPAAVTIFVGQNRSLTARALTAAGDPIAGVTFTWQSANPAVATVSSAGVVTGVAIGTTHVIATDTQSGIGLMIPVAISDFPPPPQ